MCLVIVILSSARFEDKNQRYALLQWQADKVGHMKIEQSFDVFSVTDNDTKVYRLFFLANMQEWLEKMLF